MAGFFKKVLKGILNVAGTVVSFVAPQLGANILVAGSNIDTGTKTSSVDVVSTASSNLQQAIDTAKVMKTSSETVDVWYWIKENWFIIAGGAAALFLLPKLFKRGRR